MKSESLETPETRPSELLTASQFARFCHVDLKTIHNWADKGEVRHFRTPGRHLRFRRGDVLDFLRKYGYPVPESLRTAKPRVGIIDDDPHVPPSLRPPLATHFQPTTSQNPFHPPPPLPPDPPDATL